jgi:hypothetical protein
MGSGTPTPNTHTIRIGRNATTEIKGHELKLSRFDGYMV